MLYDWNSILDVWLPTQAAEGAGSRRNGASAEQLALAESRIGVGPAIDETKKRIRHLTI